MNRSRARSRSPRATSATANGRLYIDDTYKVTPKLTVNWGLRWEVAQPLLDKYGLEPNFQLKQPLPSIANDPEYRATIRCSCERGREIFTKAWTSALPVPVQLARDGRLGDRMIKTDYNNFAPRLGIAYSPSAKWSFRAGFGVFFSQESKNSIFDLNRATGGRANPRIDLQGIPTLTLQNFINTTQLPVKFAPGLTWGVDHRLPTLTPCSTCSISSGRSGATRRSSWGTRATRAARWRTWSTRTRRCPGSPRSTPREPYPEWHGIQYLNGDGIANYNAFSGKLTQRFGRNLTTLFSYTWSKALDENSAIRGTGSDFTLENQRCRSCDYGSGRVQRAAPLCRFGPVFACRSARAAISESRRGRGPGDRRLAGEHHHDRCRAARRSIRTRGIRRAWARASRTRTG